MAKKDTQFWRQKSKTRSPRRLFTEPKMLWDAACEYFEWCDKNPWVTRKTKTRQSGFEIEEIPVQRPYSLTGFCLYIGACEEYWRSFRKLVIKQEEDSYIGVMARIEAIIETQQFEGATVGAFNPNIIARKLGLIDKQEVVNPYAQVTESPLNNLSAEKLEKLEKEIQKIIDDK